MMLPPEPLSAPTPLSRYSAASLSKSFKGFLLSLVIAAGLLLVHSSHASELVKPAQGDVFDYAWLKAYAKSLSKKAYVSHKGELPQQVKGLDWDEYQQLRYDKQKALWRDKDLAFRAELFHLGLYFDTPVQIYKLKHGQTALIGYSSSMFDYGDTGIDGDTLPADLGYAGFRMQFHKDWQRDVVAFLGASYFRAVGKEMQYGLSARGLAIDTALPRAEEFPMFTHFWLEEPKPGSNSTIVYALLDSPSATGAYRFDITPADTLTMKVDAAIYPRKDIERLGIAPLTSMFMVGENDRRTGWDWRPEIHDSDGLALHTGNGEWIWRPLNNPRNLRFNAYSDHNPRGFGLMQRDRDFDHYQDDGVFYDRRPSLWIEPIGKWGKGSVQLVEIPTIDETFDNIVAFWNPEQPVKAGQELQYSYMMYWGGVPPVEPPMAKVVDTFTGLGGVVGKVREYYSQRFVLDFAGGKLADLPEGTDVKPNITVSSGRVEVTSARPQHAISGYRAMFDVVPDDSVSEPINLRVYLEANGEPLTETWLYQWSPPPQDQQDLHNPGHL